MPKQKLIVGIDPGITCSIAILDIGGRPLSLRTEKGFRRSSIIKEISKWGLPVIVASDVTHAPDLVRKVASVLNAVVYTPEKDLVVDEKEEVAKEFSKLNQIDVPNVHSRDALSAAVKAYQHYRSKFQRVETEASKMGIHGDLESAKALVVQGNTVKKALTQITKSVEDRSTPEIRPRNNLVRKSLLEQRLKAKEEQIQSLEADNLRLMEEIRGLKAQLEQLRSRVERSLREQDQEIKRDRLYETQRIEIINLRAELNKMKIELESSKDRMNFLGKLQRVESTSDLVLLKPIHRFTEKGVEEAIRDFAIRGGEPVILLDASGGGVSTAETLADLRPSVVIASNKMSHQASETLLKRGIALASANQIDISWVEGFPYLSTEELNKAIRLAGLDRRIRTLEDVEALVRQYRELGA